MSYRNGIQNNIVQNNYYNSNGFGQNRNPLQSNQMRGGKMQVMMGMLQQMDQMLDMMGEMGRGDGGSLSPEAMGALDGGGGSQGCCCCNNLAEAFGGPNEAQKSEDEKVKFDYEGEKKGKKGKEGQPEKFNFEGNPDQLKGLLESARAKKTEKAA